jgi:hypothetical protein
VPLIPEDNPPPLTVAASLVVLQGGCLVAFGVLELANLTSERMEMGVSTAIFFVGYGVALMACAWGLTRRHGWTRGPVLITQLIQLGLAWNVRDASLVAVALAVTAAVVLAGMLHPATLNVLQE